MDKFLIHSVFKILNLLYILHQENMEIEAMIVAAHGCDNAVVDDFIEKQNKRFVEELKSDGEDKKEKE